VPGGDALPMECTMDDLVSGRGRLVAATCLVLAAGIVNHAWATAPTAQAAGTAIHLPLSLQRFGAPFANAPTVRPVTQSPTAAATATSAGPTATLTPYASPTLGPTPTPTLPGNAVEYPTDAKTIVLQIGMTNLDDPGAVWEEMNGTPWLTLYGDGRVITQHTLDPSKAGYDRAQTLYVGTVSEYTIQLWLRTLVYDVGFFGLKDDYVHGRGSKPEVHVWLNATGNSKRVGLRGFFSFERYRAAEFPADKDKIMALVALVRSLERDVRSTGAYPITQGYEPECYTIIAQKSEGADYLADPPRWDGSVNVAAIAEAAPTAASNYVDKVPGHKFVDAALGSEMRALVLPVAEKWFPLNLRASEYLAGSRRHVVGIRQEVPGGSMFLPLLPNAGGWAGGTDLRRSYWYRRDAGSGSCAILPGRPLAGDARDTRAWAEVVSALQRERDLATRPFARLSAALVPGRAPGLP
jgi:hypothetical protein